MLSSGLRPAPAVSQPASADPALQVCIVADDLTGACDAAAPFAAQGLVTEVLLARGLPPSRQVRVWARSTSTRDTDPAQLHRCLAAELVSLPPHALLFKKIDSGFRGNTMAEIAAMLRLLPDRPAVLAPAFPALGRTFRDGVLQIIDLSGAHRVPVAEGLRSRGIPVAAIPSGLSTDLLASRLREIWSRSPRPVACCDAEIQGNLETVVAAVRGCAHPVLWIGSAGLAHALAASLPAPAANPVPHRPRAGRLVFFIGSNHPVTLAQVRALRAAEDAPDRIRIVDVPRGSASAQSIRDALAGMSPQQIPCLFMTGGDTASLACEALGIASLRIVREFAPGLPQATAVGGSFDGVPILLKSGGFGDPQVLCEIARAFGSPATASVASSSHPEHPLSGDLL